MKKITIMHGDTHMQHTAPGPEENQIARTDKISSYATPLLQLVAGMTGQINTKIITKNSLNKCGAVDPANSAAT